jgi:hypothetical protein
MTGVCFELLGDGLDRRGEVCRHRDLYLVCHCVADNQRSDQAGKGFDGQAGHGRQHEYAPEKRKSAEVLLQIVRAI